MRDKLYPLLGIESGEEPMASMFLTQAILLGIFFGAYDITAHSLLLSTFDEKIMARGFVVSGITGIILVSLYSWSRARIQFKKFASINLCVVTILTLLLWSALIFSSSKLTIFVVYVMFGPLNILALLGFLTTADRLFPGRQRQRQRQLGDVGIIIGIIIISIIIPLLLSFKFRLSNILLFSVFSLLAATIIQILIGAKFSLLVTDETFSDSSEKRESMFVVFRNDLYIRIISIFAVFSVLAFFFIQYSFMAVTRQQYPVAENMAVFLGLFTAGMMTLTLFLKQVIFKYVLYNYGLQICLLISPVLITLFTGIAVAIGFIAGYTPESTIGFIIFFFLITITRLISKALSDAVESPSLKVIYQALDKKIKFKLQSGMVGFIYEMTVMLSGIILTGLGLLSFIKLIHFSVLLIILCSIWLFVALKLFKEYRKSILIAAEKVAREETKGDTSNKYDIFKNRFSANLAFRSNYFSLISGDFSVLNKISNKRYFERLIDYAGTKEDINLLPALKKTSDDFKLDEETRKHAAAVAELLKKHSTSFGPDDEKIDNAQKMLSGARMPQTTEIFKLLRDNSIESKRLAIYMIGKFRISDLLRDVCECLSIPGLTIDAYEVLKSFGPDAANELMRFYVITSGNLTVSRIILRLLGKTCTEGSIGFLFSRLWSNSRQQKEIAVKCLINCKYKPSDEEKQRLDLLASDIIGFITWDLSAKISLEKANDSFLLEKINRETDRWNRFLFDILSITYNSGAINKIREYFEGETMESVNYAFEMTDIILSETIKPKLVALLDFVPDEDKIRNLFQFFPGEIPAHDKLLEDIINRDYNLISLWTKACTLRDIAKIDSDDMAESVTALLFSPEEIIQEESANLIARSNPQLYVSASARIPDSIKKRLDNIVNGTTDKNDLIFEKVYFLSKNFEGIPEDELLSLADEMKYISDFDTESVMSSAGCVIWPLCHENEVHVLPGGISDSLKRKYQNEPNCDVYFLPLIAVEEYFFHFPEKSFEILKYIDKNEE